MDSSLASAIAVAIASASRTSSSVSKFLRDVSAARDDLSPVLCDLVDLRNALEQLAESDAVPQPLFASLLWIIRACSDVLAQIDLALNDCDRDSLNSGRWLLTQAALDVQGLSIGLGLCHKILRLMMEVMYVDVDNESTNNEMDEVDASRLDIDLDRIITQVRNLRIEMSSGHLETSRLEVIMSHCLQDIGNYVESMDQGASGSRHLGLTAPPTPPLSRQSVSSTSSGRPTKEDYGSERREPPVSMHRISKALRRASNVSSEQSEASPTANAHLTSDYGSTGRSHTVARYPDSSSLARPSLHAKTSLPRRPSQEPSAEVQHSRPFTSSIGSTTAFPGLNPSSPSCGRFPTQPPDRQLPPIPIRSARRRADSTTSATSQQRRGTRPNENAQSHMSVASASSAGKARTLSDSPSSPKSYVTTSTNHRPNESDGLMVAHPLIKVVPKRRLVVKEKFSSGGVFYVDSSPSASMVASRHGKNLVRIWRVSDGAPVESIKASFMIQPVIRSRDYFVRSHAILSESTHLIAVATGFGHSLDIWDWAKKKKLQTIDKTHRWIALRSNMCQATQPALACYDRDTSCISLYPVARTPTHKKPFAEPRLIDLKQADLPHMPVLPEFAFSTNSSVLVAMAGPRPPRPNMPPSEHTALLMAWQVTDDPSYVQSHKPFKFLEPHWHTQLATALPLTMAVSDTTAISIWIPAAFRTFGVPGKWQVESSPIEKHYVLVWDFGTPACSSSASTNSTVLYAIPNAPSCVSPDCRYVAYCDAEGGCLVVLDAMNGQELWRWSSEDAELTGKAEYDQMGLFHKITDLVFSNDGEKLFVGDQDGTVGVYDVKKEGDFF